MAIRYYNDDCTFRLPQKRLTAAWLRAVAEAEGYTPGDVSYIFCSAQRLLEMNRQWLGHDAHLLSDAGCFASGSGTTISPTSLRSITATAKAPA